MKYLLPILLCIPPTQVPTYVRPDVPVGVSTGEGEVFNEAALRSFIARAGVELAWSADLNDLRRACSLVRGFIDPVAQPELHHNLKVIIDGHGSTAPFFQPMPSGQSYVRETATVLVSDSLSLTEPE